MLLLLLCFFVFSICRRLLKKYRTEITISVYQHARPKITSTTGNHFVRCLQQKNKNNIKNYIKTIRSHRDCPTTEYLPRRHPYTIFTSTRITRDLQRLHTYQTTPNNIFLQRKRQHKKLITTYVHILVVLLQLTKIRNFS